VIFDGSPRSPPELVKSSRLDSVSRNAASEPVAARPSAVGVVLATSCGRHVLPLSLVRSR
jgi:hypothetical protein